SEGTEEQPEIGEEEIADIVSMRTGMPVFKLTEAESQKLIRMEDELHKRVIGQEEAIIAVSKSIRRARAGIKDPKRPTGSFIFLGPSGVGKTELARTLAEFLFGDEDAMIQIDMSEYMEKHAVSRLVGSPPGYIGYDEGGQLTEAVRRKPYSVVLFDEIIVFPKLSREEILQIVDLMLNRLRVQMAEHETTLELTDEARDMLVEKGYDPAMGARPLRRAIQRYIEDPLADFVLGRQLAP